MTYPGSQPTRQGDFPDPDVQPATEPPRPGLISNPDFFREIVSLGTPSFEESKPRDFDFMVMLLQSNIPELSKSRAEAYVEEYAASWMEDLGVWPSVGDAAGDAGFVVGGLKLPSWADYLPEVFVVVDEAGQPTLYDNTTGAGPVPVPVAPENMPQAWRFGGAFGSGQDRDLGLADIMGGASAPQIPSSVPVISRAELEYVQQAWGNYLGSLGGSGGGGRSAPTFDRRAVEENIKEQWQSLLLEQPGNLSELVDAYIDEATSFYLTTGAQTSLSAWLMEEIRQTPRYKLLYGKKPDGMSEDEYLGRYQRVAGQFGLRPGSELTETVKGMSQGANLQSLAARIGQGREYMAGNQGTFSQAFANTFKSLGVLMRS